MTVAFPIPDSEPGAETPSGRYPISPNLELSNTKSENAPCSDANPHRAAKVNSREVGREMSAGLDAALCWSWAAGDRSCRLLESDVIST